MTPTRRDILKAGGLTALGLGLNLFGSALSRQHLFAGEGGSEKRLIFIFQRGGSDGINTVIPHGDPEYNRTNRPSLYIGPGTSLDLGNSFAGLHPRMAPMMEIFNSQALTGVDGPGNLAVIHRVGYDNQSQSHFDSQQYWENGTPRSNNEEGMLYRKVALTLNPDENRLAAASISSSQMVALKGPLAIPTIRSPASFNFPGNDEAKITKFLGRLPSVDRGGNGKGVLGLYGGPRDFGSKPYRDLVYGTGLALTDAINIVQAAVDEGPYVPTGGADYSAGSLGEKLSQVAMLIKRTPVQILGVNKGGWDTHTNQRIYDGQGNLLYDIARGFQALYRDLQETDPKTGRSYWEDTMVVTMTEFGRTSRENGSGGTDHAYACAMFAAGGAVTGGVYNCDDTTWAPGDMFSKRERYLAYRTDYRQIFREIFQGHFGDSLSTINQIIPGFSGLSDPDTASAFQNLGFV